MAVAPSDINYTFSESELEMLLPFGQVIHHEEGGVVAAEGDREADCLVVLSGELHIFVATLEGERRVGWMERGQFSGDINVLTGQRSLARTEMGKAGDVLHIPFARFHDLMMDNSRISDIFIRVLTARRAFGRESGNAGIFVLGNAHDRRVFAARDLLTKHGVPHHWFTPDVDPVGQRLVESRELSADDLPAVLIGSKTVLRQPSIEDISAALGLDIVPDDACVDVVVVGAGPAGLAASVYAASEGLSVVALDTDGPGGQAGTSSKIENYLGFPTGVSGRDLAERAAVQAQKFGVRIASPAKATKLEKNGDNYCLHLGDGRKISARAVVIATGAHYRRLPIENLALFEGRGVYYGATPMEAQLCHEQEVAIVGAGNSAGQGAVFLSQTAKAVHVVFRRPDIRDTMSEYLVRRLEDTPNIHLHPTAQIDTLHGVDGASADDERLSAVTWQIGDSGKCEKSPTAFVFLFVGAVPATEWLPERMSCDGKGFLKTGTDLENLDLIRADWKLDRMPTRYETSWPRVYAVGDVRTGSVKRVASAVGEGSVVVSDIHKALADEL